jgi:hypothetical protein
MLLIFKKMKMVILEAQLHNLGPKLKEILKMDNLKKIN